MLSSYLDANIVEVDLAVDRYRLTAQALARVQDQLCDLNDGSGGEEGAQDWGEGEDDDGGEDEGEGGDEGEDGDKVEYESDDGPAEVGEEVD